MRHITRPFVLVLFVAAALPWVGRAQSPAAALFQEALMLERADGKIAEAIARYERIAADFPKEDVVPQALYRLGLAYEKLANPRAAVMFERLVGSYPDAKPYAVEARARLAAMQAAAAGPFKVQDLDAYGIEQSGAYSPDGKYIAYLRDRALRVRGLSDGRERSLLEVKSDERIGRVWWSADGLRLAVDVATWDFNVPTSELRIASIAGGTVSTVATVRTLSNVAWSHDGRRLAFSAFAFAATGRPKSPEEARALFEAFRAGADAPQVWIASTDVGAAKSTALGSSLRRGELAWSPDSTQVAFVSRSGDDEVLRIVDATTKNTRTIPIARPTPATQTGLGSWKRNGEIVLKQGTADGASNVFFLVNSSGGASRKVCEGRGGPDSEQCLSISPDAKWALIKKNGGGGGRLVLKDTATGEERTLTPNAVDENPVGGFSPDGRLFAFSSNRDGQYAVYVVPVDKIPVAQPVRVMATYAYNPRDFRLNPSGWTKEGLVLRWTDRESNWYRVNMDPRTQKPAGAPLRLTHSARDNGSWAVVSSDGRRIAYDVPQTLTDTGIAVMDANGARDRIVKVLSGFDPVRLLGWQSPDDLIYAEQQLQGQDPRFRPGGLALDAPWKLTLLNVATGETRVAGPPIGRPDGIVGGTDIFFRGGAGARWSIRPIAGGTVRVLPPPGPGYDYDVIAPDGRSLVYSTDEAGTTPKDKPIPGDFRFRSLETGVERVLIRYPDSKGGNHEPVALSTDGRYLLYTDPDEVLRVMNTGTAESWPLLVSAPDGVWFGRGSWSPDGSFVIVQGVSAAEHWRAIQGITYDAVTKLLAGRR